jgi:hypothetical protein
MTLGLNRGRTDIGSNDLSIVDRQSNLDDFLTSKSILNARTQVQALNQRPIFAAIQENVINQNSLEMSGKISPLFEQAEPKILNDLDMNAGRLTQSKIKEIVIEEIKKTIQEAESQPNSGITFEVLTGKLTIDSSRPIFGITLTGGEVNVYKISATLAGGVWACNAAAGEFTFNVGEFEKCAKAALEQVGSAVAKALDAESTRSSKNLGKE